MRRWIVVNAAGAVFTLIAAEIQYQSHVPREFNPRPNGYAFAFLFQLIALVLMGFLQPALCSTVAALNSSRNKVLQVGSAIASGIVTGIMIPLFGTFVLYITALLALFTLLPSGIIFGAMLGMRRWRATSAA
jgi:hypothetical protein